jgi:AcrR family transcriptional regulator
VSLDENERSYYFLPAVVTKSEATREAILEEALSLASRIGFEPLSIGELAKAVGMSKSGLYAHFLDKEDLQLQVLQRAREIFMSQVVNPALESADGAARLQALFDHWLRWAESEAVPGGCPFISAANEYDDRPGRVRDYLVQVQERWLSNLGKAAQMAKDRGEFRADVDVDQFSHDFYAIVLAYSHFRRLLRDPRSEARARSSFEALLASSRA